MSQDELILTLLRAIARSMVCEECGGQGFTATRTEYAQATIMMTDPKECFCRTAIRELLKPQGV